MHLPSLKCKLVKAKTEGKNKKALQATTESKSWNSHSVDFCLFALVIYKNIKCQAFHTSRVTYLYFKNKP